VDNHQTIITANGHFLEMFGIPRDLIVQKDDNPVLALVVAQMAEPEAFFNKVQELYNSNKIDRDTLHLKDGRIIERYSEPLILQEKIAGRVWSFRDNTELVLAEVGLKRSEEKYRLIERKVLISYFHSMVPESSSMCRLRLKIFLATTPMTS